MFLYFLKKSAHERTVTVDNKAEIEKSRHRRATLAYMQHVQTGGKKQGALNYHLNLLEILLKRILIYYKYFESVTNAHSN